MGERLYQLYSRQAAYIPKWQELSTEEIELPVNKIVWWNGHVSVEHTQKTNNCDFNIPSQQRNVN